MSKSNCFKFYRVPRKQATWQFFKNSEPVLKNMHQNSLLVFQVNLAQIYMGYDSIFILVTVFYFLRIIFSWYRLYSHEAISSGNWADSVILIYWQPLFFLKVQKWLRKMLTILNSIQGRILSSLVEFLKVHNLNVES